ncbi:MAG: hypothetical protein ACRDQ4_14330 [Pseudonocardiaceae bacterium]
MTAAAPLSATQLATDGYARHVVARLHSCGPGWIPTAVIAAV